MDSDQSNFTVTFHDDAAYYEIVLGQNVSVETVLSIQEIVTNPVVDGQPPKVVWDIRLADLKALSFKDILSGLSGIGTDINQRAAIIFATDFQLAIARQAVAVASADTDNILFTRDPEAASAWLTK